MNKSILLGLLLVPCVSHAMDPLVVRVSTNTRTTYGKGMERAERKTTAAGYMYRAYKINLSAEMECTAQGAAAAEKFEEFEKAYNAQPNKEDHE